MIKTHIKAGYVALWFPTHEERRAIEALTKDLPKGYRAYEWDCVAGMKDKATGKATPMPDPLKAVNTIMTLPEQSVLFLKDFHKFLGDIQVIRTVKNLLEPMKKSCRHFIFISPVTNIPVELEKDIHKMDFPLPTEDELMEVATKLVKDNDLSIEVKKEDVSAGKGLTMLEIENSLSRAIIETKGISKQILEDDKLQIIKKGGLLEILQPIPADQIVMPLLMKYAEARKKGFFDPALLAIHVEPRGVLLTGFPGTGKTLAAKVIAAVFGLPLIKMDMGSLKGSHVGESEANMKNSLKQIHAIGRCVVLLDELEKFVSGVASSGKTDGGTTANMFGTLLSDMSEAQEPCYYVGTLNDTEPLFDQSQGALVRRFDDLFYVDLPNLDERMAILKIMNRRYKRNIDLSLAERMMEWTGAEIEKMAKASIYDGVEDAMRLVKPIAQQNAAMLDKIREWAKSNARRANGEWAEESTGNASRKLSL